MLEALTIPVPSLGPDFALEVGMTADAHALHGTGLPRFVLLAGAIALALALMAIELTDALRARATHAERLLHSLREQQNRRKADEAALRRSRAETHSIVESLGDGILTVAPDWTVLAANSALRDLLGRDVAAMVGRNLWRSMPELADTDVETALRQAHAECAETRFAMDSPDDARHMAVRAHPHFGGLAIHFRDVTEERAATQRLAQSEALLALSQEIAQLGSWFESAVDHRVSWSDQTYRIHGVDPAHFQPSLEAELVLIRPEDRQRVSEAREALRGNGAPIDLTYCIVRADGSERRLRLLGEALLDDQQRRLGVHGSIQDVTDQARVEERLQRSLQLLSSAEEIAGFGSWEFEFATQLMHWSHNTYRIHCVDPETYQPRMFGATEKVHVDDRQALREARDQALIKLRPFKVQYRLAGPDGKERRLQAVGRPRVDESGKPVALLGTVQDITEIHLAEQELRRNLELLELSQDIAETGRVGWSRQTYIIHGLDPDHPAIKPEESARLIHPGDRERVLSERNQLVALSWPGEAHYRIVRPDGEIRLLHVRGRPHIDKSGSMALMHGTVQDVTERYRMEQALRRSIVDLDSRNRDLREFTQIASHDLQEPLRKIQVFAGLLDQRMKAEATDPAAIRDYVERMAATAERMQWLLADLLAYSLNDSAALRVEEVLPEQILAVAKRNAEEALASCAGRIAIQVDEAAPAIRTDPVLLRQILDNLIGNAVKYRDAARPLAIRIELGARNGSSSDSTPAGWRLTVADNGIGFEPRHAERIFAPFQRLHDRQQYPGTGMGLTLVRRMAERLAGSVHAEGRPGEGATFIVEIADLPAGEDIAGSPEARWQSYFEAQYSASAGDDRQPHPPEDFDGRAV
jgi:PAS domain S-box-containing protein